MNKLLLKNKKSATFYLKKIILSINWTFIKLLHKEYRFFFFFVLFLGN